MKITVIPAIDVIGGKCVRLTRGNYDECKTYYDDPVEAARRFEAMGMKRLHLVDLDGARASRVVNWRVLERICEATSLEVDFSGGIKSDEDICRVFDAGASFVCIGSMAQQNREKTREWLETYGAGRVIVGADVRDGHVCIQGWKVETEDDDTRVNRSLFTPVEECDVYGYCPGWDAGGSFFGAVSGAGDSLSGDYAYRIRGSRCDGGYSGAGETWVISAVIVGKAFYEEFKM